MFACYRQPAAETGDLLKSLVYISIQIGFVSIVVGAGK
jgi:hypothetical protein